MKYLLISFFLFLQVSSCLRAGGDLSPQLVLCRNIEFGLYAEFLTTGRELPESLNEIELLNEIVAQNPSSGVLLNEMTVVPKSPRITEAKGISRKHFQWRIFAIGRTINTDYATLKGADGERLPGRYSVWISPDGKYCSPGWTPESEVQAVFKQIGGFDPSGQPLAFPEAMKMVREEKESKKILREQTWKDAEKTGKRTLKRLVNGGTLDAHEQPGFPWPILGLPVLALLVWLLVKVVRRKRKA